MCGNHAASGRRGAFRLVGATVAWFGALLAGALVPQAFEGRPPGPTQADAAPAAARAAVVAPARAPPAGMCFHGPGGELLQFVSAGQHCR